MATTSISRAHQHAVFRSRMMLAPRLPLPGAIDPAPIDCPRCGGQAEADRQGATIMGWHDGAGQCGWVDTLTVGRDPHGGTTLT